MISQITALLKTKKHPLILICGLPAAGKTTFSQHLKKQFPKSVVVQGDWFIKYPTFERLDRIIAAEESADTLVINQETNPINWFDWPLLEAALTTLQRTGQLTLAGGWNQETGEKNIDITLELPKTAAPIICECAYLLHLSAAQKADLCLLIDTPVALAKQRLKKREANKFTKKFLNYKDFLAYRDMLTEKFDLPYFEKYRHLAGMVIADQETLD